MDIAISNKAQVAVINSPKTNKAVFKHKICKEKTLRTSQFNSSILKHTTNTIIIIYQYHSKARDFKIYFY